MFCLADFEQQEFVGCQSPIELILAGSSFLEDSGPRVKLQR